MKKFALLFIILFASLPARAGGNLNYIVHAHFDHADETTKTATCNARSECVFSMAHHGGEITIKSTVSNDLQITFLFYKDGERLWIGNDGNTAFHVDGTSQMYTSHKVSLNLPNN